MEGTAVLSGGTRDGEETPVGPGVRVVVAPSSAPGLLDVYEGTGQAVPLRGGGSGEVFVLVDQQAATDVAPEAQHLPSS